MIPRAFAANAALESAYLINNPSVTQIDLSEVNAVVGAMTIDNRITPCDGGLSELVFEYAYTKSITTEKNYPYDAQELKADSFVADTALMKLGAGKVVATAQPYFTSKPNKAGLIAALQIQPIVVYIFVDKIFKSYKSGVFTATDCNDGSTNHAVLLVGYNMVDGYWIIKNSWDTNWGLDGYIHMKMTDDVQGMCGIYISGGISPGVNFRRKLA